MSLLVRGQTYTAPIEDPETGETITVTLRKLNARDDAALRDSMRMMGGEEEDEVNFELRLGTWQLLTVQRSIVGWDHPTDPPPTPDLVGDLHPDVFDAIYQAVERGSGIKPPEADGEHPTREASASGETQTAELLEQRPVHLSEVTPTP